MKRAVASIFSELPYTDCPRVFVGKARISKGVRGSPCRISAGGVVYLIIA